MSNFKWLNYLLVVAGFILLSGCGLESLKNDTPKDVAIAWVQKISSGDIAAAKELSTDQAKQRFSSWLIEPFLKENTQKVYRVLGDDTLNSLYKTVKSMDVSNPKNVRKYIDEFLLSKHITKNEAKNMSREESDKTASESFFWIAEKYVKPLVDKALAKSKVEVEHFEDIKKIVSGSLLLKAIKDKSDPSSAIINFFDNVTDEVIKMYSELIEYKNLPPAFVDRISSFGSVKDINYIETKQESPDKAKVRLELIYGDSVKHKNGDSDKRTIDTEKVKGKWKVDFRW